MRKASKGVHDLDHDQSLFTVDEIISILINQMATATRSLVKLQTPYQCPNASIILSHKSNSSALQVCKFNINPHS